MIIPVIVLHERDMNKLSDNELDAAEQVLQDNITEIYRERERRLP